ncbi:MAG: TerB family tellurite resistance protein, partial [Phycisphaerales bacterium]|nr:TerB family tellurite resistance protein [Phycisphaerales bacterium]
MSAQADGHVVHVNEVLRDHGMILMSIAYISCDKPDIDQEHLHVIQERVSKWYRKESSDPHNCDRKAEDTCISFVKMFIRWPADNAKIEQKLTEHLRKLTSLLMSYPDKLKRMRHRNRIIRDWVHVIAADGQVHPQEEKFLRKHATTLKVDAEIQDQLIREAIEQHAARRSARAMRADNFSAPTPPPPPPTTEVDQGSNERSVQGGTQPPPKYSSLAQQQVKEEDAGQIGQSEPRAVQSEDDLTLESVGSGSELIDLTRESDDTSLGAELLEEIYSSDDDNFELPANASGLYEAASPDETDESEEGFDMKAEEGISDGGGLPNFMGELKDAFMEGWESQKKDSKSDESDES